MAGQNHKIYVLNYLKVSLRVLRIFCSYYHEPSEPLWYTVYSIILVCFLIVIPGVLNVIKVIKCLLTSREFDMLSRGTTNMAYVTEVYCFITQKQYVSQVLMDMDSDIFEPRNGHQANLIERQLLKGKLFNVINMWVTCVLCFLYGIKPLVSGNFERVLPMNVWYPINTTISPAFEIIYAYEFTFMMLHACTHAGLASIPIITMSFLIGQLNVIADTLQNLKKYAEEDVNTDNKEDKMMKTHAEMKKLLVQCVCKHRALRRMVTDLNKLYTYHFFTVFTNAIITFALLLYQLSMEISLSCGSVTICFHLTVLMAQLLLYNWFGNEITFKSESLHIAAYSMDWPGTPIWFQKNLLFALIHFQVPMKIYAFHFFLLCLESYVSVLRTSWSYFLILTNMNDK